MNKLAVISRVYGESTDNTDGISRVFLFIFIILAVLTAVFPEYAWWIEHGMPKDSEPSDAGILVTRLGGIFCAIIGVIILVITL